MLMVHTKRGLTSLLNKEPSLTYCQRFTMKHEVSLSSSALFVSQIELHKDKLSHVLQQVESWCLFECQKTCQQVEYSTKLQR